jgi:hypothetical protein
VREYCVGARLVGVFSVFSVLCVFAGMCIHGCVSALLFNGGLYMSSVCMRMCNKILFPINTPNISTYFAQ